MSRDKLLSDTVKFCRYHLGKYCFAPLTGGDWPAWSAFVYLVQCYSHGGGTDAIAAMRATVRCAQRTEAVLGVFVQAIPAVMDWGDVARLWPQITPGEYLRDAKRPAIELYAIERSEHYRGESKQMETTRTSWGWRPMPTTQAGATP